MTALIITALVGLAAGGLVLGALWMDRRDARRRAALAEFEARWPDWREREAAMGLVFDALLEFGERMALSIDDALAGMRRALMPVSEWASEEFGPDARRWWAGETELDWWHRVMAARRHA